MPAVTLTEDANMLDAAQQLLALRRGLDVYYLDLRTSPDPVLAAGAWCALLDGGHLMPRPDLWPELVGTCRHRAVRRRAFDFFETVVLEHDLASHVAEVSADSADAPIDASRLAALDFDPAAGAAAAERLFLATGDLAALVDGQALAADAYGWRAGLVWALRVVLLSPANIALHLRVFTALNDAGQGELLARYGGIIERAGFDPTLVALFLGAAAHWRGEDEAALGFVATIDPDRLPATAPLAPHLGLVLRLRAASEDRLGRYRNAHASLLSAHRSDRRMDIDPEDYYRGVAAKKRAAIPWLPPDARNDVVQMLGFPRSGTTLLENALAAHPLIETFEEIPSLQALTERTERRGQLPDTRAAGQIAALLAARAAYYEEIDLRRQKPDATVLVDKYPIRSGEADFLARLFPSWRYIFAVRHPFDVVLSCFRQRFAPNPAMENFRTFGGAVRLYDFVMSEWFAVHGLDDASVKYVRYDELVGDFPLVTEDVLRFLGLGWDNAVSEFAAAADSRATRTPSYQKVRQGLGLGVQSSWQNYRFLFDDESARPLFKWAEFFGYPTA